MVESDEDKTEEKEKTPTQQKPDEEFDNFADFGSSGAVDASFGNFEENKLEFAAFPGQSSVTESHTVDDDFFSSVQDGAKDESAGNDFSGFDAFSSSAPNNTTDNQPFSGDESWAADFGEISIKKPEPKPDPTKNFVPETFETAYSNAVETLESRLNSKSKNSTNCQTFQPLHNYAIHDCNQRNDPDGLDDRLKVDRSDQNFRKSLFSAAICTNNEPVFRYKWHKSKLKRKYDKARDNLLSQTD